MPSDRNYVRWILSQRRKNSTTPCSSRLFSVFSMTKMFSSGKTPHTTRRCQMWMIFWNSYKNVDYVQNLQKLPRTSRLEMTQKDLTRRTRVSKANLNRPRPFQPRTHQLSFTMVQYRHFTQTYRENVLCVKVNTLFTDVQSSKGWINPID